MWEHSQEQKIRHDKANIVEEVHYQLFYRLLLDFAELVIQPECAFDAFRKPK